MSEVDEPKSSVRMQSQVPPLRMEMYPSRLRPRMRSHVFFKGGKNKLEPFLEIAQRQLEPARAGEGAKGCRRIRRGQDELGDEIAAGRKEKHVEIQKTWMRLLGGYSPCMQALCMKN